MTHSTLQTLGVDLDRVYTVAELADEQVSTHALGQQEFASDGKLYVFAEADAAITLSLIHI